MGTPPSQTNNDKKKRDFKNPDIQADILWNALNHLLDYYENEVATEAERKNYKKDKAYIDEVIVALRSNVLKKIDSTNAKSKNLQVDPQVGVIVQMLDQISERLKLIKREEALPSRPTFGEIVYASAIVATKVTEEHATWNTEFTPMMRNILMNEEFKEDRIHLKIYWKS
jgi:hypothetical protein